METKKRERLSIDILAQEHRKIKVYAAFYGITIRELLMKIIKEYLKKEEEKKTLAILTARLEEDPLLQNLWNNEKDADYDNL